MIFAQDRADRFDFQYEGAVAEPSEVVQRNTKRLNEDGDGQHCLKGTAGKIQIDRGQYVEEQ